MKRFLLIAIALMMIFALASCGITGKTPSGNGTTSSDESSTPDTDVSQPESSGTPGEIDLSQFTPVELPESSLLEDWMKPDFGVVTSGSETMKDWMYAFTVCGVTEADVESYRQVLRDHGYEGTTFSFENDTVAISLGTAAVGTTAESYMTVTIEKK